MMGKKAVVRISGDILCNMLFPKGTVILDIIKNPNVFCSEVNEYLIKIENPDLPDTDEGNNYPIISPNYRRIYSGKENEVDIVEMIDWGLDKS